MEKGVAGVYAITCLTDGRRYIGSSRDIRKRWYRHRYRLRSGQHHIAALQLDWNEYGESAFGFGVLLTCDPGQLLAAEQAVLDLAHGAGLCYNPSTSAVAARGYKLTPDQRAAISAAQMGRTVSVETRRKIGDANRANWAQREITPEVRERMASMGRKSKGRPKPADQRRKISDAQKGREFSDEHLANLRAAKRSRPGSGTKLTVEKVREIKRRLAAGERNKDLAAEFEISAPIISNIKTGRIWRDVA